MANKLGTDFTKGSIPKKLILFALPLMAANLLQVAYSMVDMIIVGNFVGSAAISAVNTAGQVCMFFTMIATGYDAGCQIYLTQLIGMGRRDRLNSAIGTIFTVTMSAGIISSILIVVLGRQLLTLVNTPPEAFSMAMDYLTICGSFIFLTFGYNLVSSLQRAQGDSRHPLMFIALATVINIVLDLLLTGYLGWGTRGAAIATVVGQGVSFFVALGHLWRNRVHFGFDFKPRSFRIDRGVLSGINSLGLVNVIQFAVIYISMISVTAMVNHLGVAPSATLGIGLKIDDVMSKVTIAISIACTTMVGTNFGAGELERVKKVVHTAWAFGFGFYALFSVLYLGFARQLFGAFTSDPEVVALAPNWIFASLSAFVGYSLMRGGMGLVQGTGFVRLLFITSIIDGLIWRIGVSYLLGTVFNLGLFGYFLGYHTAVYATAIPALVYYLSGAWKKRKLIVN